MNTNSDLQTTQDGAGQGPILFETNSIPRHRVPSQENSRPNAKSVDPRNGNFHLGDFLPKVQEKKAATGNATASTKSKDKMNITHYYTQTHNNL